MFCTAWKKQTSSITSCVLSINISVSVFLFVQPLTNEHEERHKPITPKASEPEEVETVTVATHVKTARRKDKANKKMDKATKKIDNRGGKPGKDSKISVKKTGKKQFPYPKKEDYPKPTKKPVPSPKSSLPLFLDHFDNKRRLLVRENLLNNWWWASVQLSVLDCVFITAGSWVMIACSI